MLTEESSYRVLYCRFSAVRPREALQVHKITFSALPLAHACGGL